MSVLIVSMTMSYARHVLVSGSADESMLKVQRAEAAAGSGLAWAKQSLLVAGQSATSLSIDDSSSVDVTVADRGGDTRAITVRSGDEGYDQQVTALAEVFALANGKLPELSTAGRAAFAAATDIIDITSNTKYSDTELTGILYLHNGVKLTLEDVVLDGTIVSQPALSEGGWTKSEATSITIVGGLLIDPGATLPDCAIIAPDAEVIAESSSRIQLHGVVVADSLSIQGVGLLHGQIATTSTPSFSESVEMPGSGRAPRAWPDSIDTGAKGVGRVYFAAQDPTSAETNAIKAFGFPVRAVDTGDP
jgi:hypothetical protein